MKEEFDRKKALFEDDAAFIQEVREGHSQAMGMDPDQELRILKLRFTAFKRDFKVPACHPALLAMHIRSGHPKEVQSCLITCRGGFVPGTTLG